MAKTYQCRLFTPPTVPAQQSMSRQISRHPRSGMPAARRTVLDRVALRNFEGHVDLSLDVRKITVLIGPTASDMSAVLRALALLKSVLEGHRSEHPSGSGPDVGQPAGGDADLNASIGVDGHSMITASGSGGIDTRFSYRMALDKSLSPTGMNASVDVCCGSSAAGQGTVRLEHSLSQGVGKALVFGAEGSGGAPMPARSDGLFAPCIRADLAGGDAAKAFDCMFSGGWYFATLLGGLRHVPLPWATPPRYRGGDSPPPEKVSSLLEEVDLGRIATSIAAAGSKGGGAGREQDMQWVPGTVAGTGPDTRRPRTVLAALAHSSRGSIVAIEEPEMHLDPAAQVALSKIMVRQAVEEDRQVIFTPTATTCCTRCLHTSRKKAIRWGPTMSPYTALEWTGAERPQVPSASA